MYCNKYKNRKFNFILIIVGLFSLLFGVINFSLGIDESHNSSMLMGMFSGLGASFIVIGVIQFIRPKVVSSEKLKQEEIDSNDERNIQLMRIAYTVSSVSATIIFAILSFLFLWLGYRVPAFIAVGCIYVQLLVYIIAHKYYSTKM